MDARHPLAVITPTLDGDVLTCLARAHASFTPGQVQRMLPDSSVHGIRKVLNRLAAEGIVTTARGGGSAVMYSLNRDHLAADAVMELVYQGNRLTERLESALNEWSVKPWYAALFGSWARGSAQGDSDVDIFLVRPPAANDEVWDAQVYVLEQAVRKWTGNDGQCFTVDQADLDSLSSDPVLRSIRDGGLTLYGRKSDLVSALTHKERS